MNKKFFIVAMAFFVTLSLSGVSSAADKTVKTIAPAAAQKAAPKKANFDMVAGVIESIDNTNPSEVKIKVKNNAGDSSRVVAVTPWTNITKVTDVSELKAGEQVRMMTRKVDDKDVAMGIMFGKMKTIPAPMAKTPQAAKTTAPVKK